MKKLFLVLSVLILAFSYVYSQGDATPQDGQQAPENAQNDGDFMTNMNTPEAILPFSPTFSVLRDTDDALLEKDFQVLQSNITVIREDYLFRILYKADKILQGYTNQYFVDTNDMIYNGIYYYNLVAGPMAGDNNVDLGIEKVNRAIENYNKLEPMMKILGKTNELAQANFDLNLYGGILNLYKGSKLYFTQSANHFNSILKSGYDQNTNNLIMLNTYLAGVNNILSTQNQDNDIMKIYYLNEMFNNLWDLITLKTADENLRDAKYKLLINKYHNILYTTSERFKTTYSKYFDELGFTYADTEEAILGKEIRPEYQNNVDNTSDATAQPEETTKTN